MADRRKGDLDAIEREWQNSSNQYRVRHLIANLQGWFMGQLNGLYVWTASNCSNKSDLLIEIAKLKEFNPSTYDWMMRIPQRHWCVHAFDKHVKAAHTTNNISESFYRWVDKYRTEHIPTLP
ncbi:hypothetical protein Ddye_002432 [Dipteronia dyeriana]|uniref:Uncharacterized protein n=1 Tax=Dipteronia dyeriana TaxID=168575 RepID=A0AAD9XR33_9ROSI|nr:hypothetical protein Ddye_002432 [Dipteronia dyeriana]